MPCNRNFVQDPASLTADEGNDTLNVSSEEESEIDDDNFKHSDLDPAVLNEEFEACRHVFDSNHDDGSDDEGWGSPQGQREELLEDDAIDTLDCVEALSELNRMATLIERDVAEYDAKYAAPFQLVRQRTKELCDEIPTNKTITLKSMIKTDEDLVAFTGLHTRLFENIVEVLKECESMSQHTNKFVLSIEDRLILCMTKLRINLSFRCLSVLFRVTRQTCANIFVYIVYLLQSAFADAIFWPTDEEHEKNIPSCFREFRNVRVVLDCTEIFIERLKCLNCRLKLYSFYKRNEILKILFGVSPSGLINFVSDT